jgi:hypothetical protein
MLNKPMKPIDKEDTINKSILLNWLYSADKELSISELGRWIEARTGGKYILIQKEQETDVAAMQLVAEHLNNKIQINKNNKLNNGDK